MAKKKNEWSATILEISDEDFTNIGFDIRSLPPDLLEDIVDGLKCHYNEMLNFKETFRKIVNKIIMEDSDEDFD